MTPPRRAAALARRAAVWTALWLLTALLFVALYSCAGPVRKESQAILFMATHPTASREAKRAFKLADDYRYMRFVRQHTSPDAVILMFPLKANRSRLSNRDWCQGMLYPRRLVLSSEPRAESVSHVMILGGERPAADLEGPPVISMAGIDYGLFDVNSRQLLRLE